MPAEQSMLQTRHGNIQRHGLYKTFYEDTVLQRRMSATLVRLRGLADHIEKDDPAMHNMSPIPTRNRFYSTKPRYRIVQDASKMVH